MISLNTTWGVILACVIGCIPAIVVAVILVNRFVGIKKGTKSTIDVRPVQNVYGSTAFPQLQEHDVQFGQQADMTTEIIDIVKSIFDEELGEETTLVKENTQNIDSGDFALTYHISGKDYPLTFSCDCLSTFELFYDSENNWIREPLKEQTDKLYLHQITQPNVRTAIRLMKDVNYPSLMPAAFEEGASCFGVAMPRPQTRRPDRSQQAVQGCPIPIRNHRLR